MRMVTVAMVAAAACGGPRAAARPANREGARFCDSCGAVLLEESAREQRKVVTVLFCDVAGSTALGERLDPSEGFSGESDG